MKSFKTFLGEARGGSWIVINKKTKKPVNDTKGQVWLFGTERDAWDIADKYTRRGEEYTIAKRPTGNE